MNDFVLIELSEERLDALLGIWAAWMREPIGAVMGLDLPSQSVGFINKPWGYWEHTSRDQAEAEEYSKADAINTVIEDLPASQRCAVMHKHLYAVFKFRDFEANYLEARKALAVGLLKRGIY